MDDKNLMENLLLLQKGLCDLYMHATVESSTTDVHRAFKSALDESLCMQNSIYDKMAEKGWYSTQNAEQNKIDSVKQKFSSVQ